MSREVTIKVAHLELPGVLDDTPTARAFADCLPFVGEISEWGDEFYFATPVDQPLDETATVDVEVGTIGYWPPGKAVAIFFGPTPMSTGEKPVPASEVNLIGRIEGAEELRSVKGTREIEVVVRS